MTRQHLGTILSLLLGLLSIPPVVFGQSNGTVSGTVTLESSGKPVHNATVTIIQLKRSTNTDDNGHYEFTDVPAGKYDISAHLERVPDVVQTVTLVGDSAASIDFQLQLRVAGEQVVVTASGDEETSFNSIQSVTTVNALELSERNSQSLGEVLDHELGVAKRSFGPGSARPVLRGFDGDRVLVLQDGDRIGTLGFQSGDHAESVDILSLEKLEVVKGPATLLYGSNAIGGVVNAITGHDHALPGLSGYLTGVGSTNYYQGGGSAGIQYGTKNWLFWGGGSSQRTGDYNTPLGRVTNSYVFNKSGYGGVGYYPGLSFFTLNYTYDKKRYGIPFNTAEEDPEVVFLNPRRNSIQFTGGTREIGSFIDGVHVSLQYTDYRHEEKNGFTQEVNTAFKNKTFTYRGEFDEKRV
ncbi:MAG: TonB-dependent receptor plug domain-containing protein, partial [Acidobacteriota bacterium]